MEQRNEERLKRAIADFRRQADEHNARVDTFMKEFWTTEVKQMFSAIVDGFKYRSTFDKAYHEGKIRTKGCELHPGLSYTNHTINNQYIYYHDSACTRKVYEHYKSKSFVNEDIDGLSISIHDLHACMETFKILQDNAEDIISTITSLYKEVTEKQSDELDKVFEELGIEEPKTRHIKVTVEWV